MHRNSYIFENTNTKRFGKTVTGSDDIPAEVYRLYKFCPKVQNELFQFVSYMWDNEVVPPNLVTTNFKMLFKHKESKDDPSSYRCIALLNHTYKVLSIILLDRLLDLSSMILRVLCEKMVEMGESIAVVFVDYSTAFDSVSHKFVDPVLKESGASPEACVMCHAIYKAASAFTSVSGADGQQVSLSCENFQIYVVRGVLQGDVTSPLYFILALELLLVLDTVGPTANTRILPGPKWQKQIHCVLQDARHLSGLKT